MFLILCLLQIQFLLYIITIFVAMGIQIFTLFSVKIDLFFLCCCCLFMFLYVVAVGTFQPKAPLYKCRGYHTIFPKWAPKLKYLRSHFQQIHKREPLKHQHCVTRRDRRWSPSVDGIYSFMSPLTLSSSAFLNSIGHHLWQ